MACCRRISRSWRSACRRKGRRRPIPTSTFAQRARDGIERFSRRALDESHWADFARSLFFVQGSFNDTRAYAQLKAKLDALDQQFGIPGSRVFYLAVPPQVVHLCVQHLKEAGHGPRCRRSTTASRASSSRSRSAATWTVLAR